MNIVALYTNDLSLFWTNKRLGGYPSIKRGQQLMVERFFTDGQSMEGRCVETASLKFANIYTENGKLNIFTD